MKTSGYIRHLIVCVVCSTSLFAQCENKGTTGDVTECYEQEFRKADAELNRVYKQVLKDLDSEDAARLHKAQRAWVLYRDAQCDAEYALWGGGTGGIGWPPALPSEVDASTYQLSPGFLQSFPVRSEHPETVVK